MSVARSEGRCFLHYASLIDLGLLVKSISRSKTKNPIITRKAILDTKNNFLHVVTKTENDHGIAIYDGDCIECGNSISGLFVCEVLFRRCGNCHTKIMAKEGLEYEPLDLSNDS
jgi:hypothetical protein